MIFILCSGSSTGEGFCVFYGRRLEKFCDCLTEYARNLALKPLGKYSGSKSATSLATTASHSTQATLGYYNHCVFSDWYTCILAWFSIVCTHYTDVHDYVAFGYVYTHVTECIHGSVQYI